MNGEHEGLAKLLDENAVVVQECFQARVDAFMETVGKEIFGVKCYWG